MNSQTFEWSWSNQKQLQQSGEHGDQRDINPLFWDEQLFHQHCLMLASSRQLNERLSDFLPVLIN